MARNRKDSTGSTVVDSYRKQIAKQDVKKSKIKMKETKFRAQKKENASSQYKDIALMVAVMLIFGCFIYIALYAILSNKTLKSMNWLDV